MTAAARVRAPLRHLAVALASLTIAVGAVELSARTFAPEWLRARMREVAVGRSLADWGSDDAWPVERDEGRPVRFVPGNQFSVRHDEYAHAVRIDEYGGRASGRAVAAGRPIAPVFGDSMTFGIGVRDEETFISLIDRSLPVRLVNFAMPGSELLDQLDALDRLDARLGAPPLCLFVVFLGNDLTDIASAGDADAGETGPSLSDGLFMVNRALDDQWMLRRWYTVQWMRALAVRRVNSSRREPQAERVFALMDRAAPLDRVGLTFGHAVDRLVSTAIRLRFRPLIVIVPDRFQVDERIRRDKAALYGVPMASYDPRRPNRLVAETLTARGVAFTDATACLEGRAGQYYVRDMHLTAAGHATLARCVGGFIAERSSDRFR